MIFERTFVVAPQLIFEIKRVPLKKIATEAEDHKLIPIQNSAYFHLSNSVGKDPFLLPKLYAALTHLTGPSDSWYDDYKGSYSFTFELKVQKDYQSSAYFYHLYHYRSYIEFSLLHITEESDPRDPRIMHQPDDALFSNLDICKFSSYFCNYSLTYMEGSKYISQPFLKYANSNNLLFGYLNNQYFLESYKNPYEYEKDKTLLKSKCGIEEIDLKDYDQYWDAIYEQDDKIAERMLIAKKSLNEGIDPMLVSKITGLSSIELQKIANDTF